MNGTIMGYKKTDTTSYDLVMYEDGTMQVKFWCSTEETYKARKIENIEQFERLDFKC